MFDANAAHINIGDLFFAEVHCINARLESLGLKVGDIVLCEHVEKTDDCVKRNILSKVWLSKDAKPIDYSPNCPSGDLSWLVYSGRPNGQGFICPKWEAKALAFLGGKWNAK
ncbi:caspase family protein [Vibrio fluvialis]|nr:caspase family protein [Vibrio fluvialis]